MNRDQLLQRIQQAARDRETLLLLGGQGNQLTALPAEIGNLTALTELYLQGNQLTALPAEIGNLTALTELFLDGNQLTALSAQIGRLTNLRRLDLGDAGRTNPLESLPPELGRLQALQTLRLTGLELTDPPPEIVEQGTQAVLAYLREQLERETRIWESRLMIVGEGGVGKTQLLRERFLRLMECFDLSFRIPDDPRNRSLVVERLSYDPPEYAKSKYRKQWDALRDERNCREIRMKFDPQSTRPAGIPTWFIARSHRFTTSTHWRFGAVFEDHPHRRHLALVEAPAGGNHVTLTVRGPNPYNFFTVLRDGLEVTLARFEGLRIKRTVPCPARLADGAACTHEFDLAHLESRLARPRPKETIECPVCEADVPVAEMLFGLHWTTQDRVLERLDKLDRADEKRTRRVLNEISDLRELSQRQFLTWFNAEQRLAESHCPRVFSLRPLRRKVWPEIAEKLLGIQWQMQLYCEAPGCWHPAAAGKQQGKYTIPAPAEWMQTVAPWVKRLITVFQYAGHFAGPVMGFAAAELNKVLADDVKLMKALVDKLPDVSPDQDLKAKHDLAATGREKTRADGGASLRGLRHLLLELDEQQEWGGLRKTLTPEGHWLWLCEEHAEVYLR